MSNVNNILKCFAVLLMLGGAAACAGSETKESTGEYIDDATITTKVKAAILKDSELSALEINVETFKGVVQLGGFVSSQAHASKALRVARSVKGVTRVENKMSVK